LFPFMLFNGSVCFFFLYHYESNAILATPIAGLDDVSIFNAYKKYFEDLTAKGFKPMLNIMDNQATQHIKKFSQRTTASCKLLNLITIVLTPQNRPFKPSRQRSLLPWQQLIVISPSNCGIGLPHKSRTPSTCCRLRESTHPNQRMRYSKDRTIGTNINCPIWVQSHCLQGRQHTRDMGIPRH
jgi:hypothetical protein